MGFASGRRRRSHPERPRPARKPACDVAVDLRARRVQQRVGVAAEIREECDRARREAVGARQRPLRRVRGLEECGADQQHPALELPRLERALQLRVDAGHHRQPAVAGAAHGAARGALAPGAVVERPQVQLVRVTERARGQLPHQVARQLVHGVAVRRAEVRTGLAHDVAAPDAAAHPVPLGMRLEVAEASVPVRVDRRRGRGIGIPGLAAAAVPQRAVVGVVGGGIEQLVLHHVAAGCEPDAELREPAVSGLSRRPQVHAVVRHPAEERGVPAVLPRPEAARLERRPLHPREPLRQRHRRARHERAPLAQPVEAHADGLEERIGPVQGAGAALALDHVDATAVASQALEPECIGGIGDSQAAGWRGATVREQRRDERIGTPVAEHDDVPRRRQRARIGDANASRAQPGEADQQLAHFDRGETLRGGVVVGVIVVPPVDGVRRRRGGLG